MQTTHRLHALELTFSVIERLLPVVKTIEAQDRDLGRQIRRSASSIALNLDEGNGSEAGTRRVRMMSALGSCRETRTALRVAACWGYLPRDAHADLDRDLDRIGAMTYRLSRA